MIDLLNTYHVFAWTLFAVGMYCAGKALFGLKGER